MAATVESIDVFHSLNGKDNVTRSYPVQKFQDRLAERTNEHRGSKGGEFRPRLVKTEFQSF
ncbi:hypothetical protein ElyMa_003945900, partial [Elysia marginata]